jgi:hypothetical protein
LSRRTERCASYRAKGESGGEKSYLVPRWVKDSTSGTVYPVMGWAYQGKRGIYKHILAVKMLADN